MTKEIQTTVLAGTMILIFGIGFFIGYLVSDSGHPKVVHETGSNPNAPADTVPLSDAGRRVATGLISSCGNSEPLLVHNCGSANEMKRMIESLLQSGLSEQETREALIKTYGQKIVQTGQEMH